MAAAARAVGAETEVAAKGAAVATAEEATVGAAEAMVAATAVADAVAAGMEVAYAGHLNEECERVMVRIGDSEDVGPGRVGGERARILERALAGDVQ